MTDPIEDKNAHFYELVSNEYKPERDEYAILKNPKFEFFNNLSLRLNRKDNVQEYNHKIAFYDDYYHYYERTNKTQEITLYKGKFTRHKVKAVIFEWVKMVQKSGREL